MSILRRTWRGLWHRFSRDEDWSGEGDSGAAWLLPAFRLTVVFALLFGGVFFAFWWAGSAVRFGAARATDRSVPTWRVRGTVRDALTHQPVPWALVEDDPAGQPPFFRAEADFSGAFDLLTLAEPHRLRASAPGYRPLLLDIGRAWFMWMPRGNEMKNIELLPLTGIVPPQIGGGTMPPGSEKKSQNHDAHGENVLHATVSGARLVMVGLVPAGIDILDCNGHQRIYYCYFGCFVRLLAAV